MLIGSALIRNKTLRTSTTLEFFSETVPVLSSVKLKYTQVINMHTHSAHMHAHNTYTHMHAICSVIDGNIYVDNIRNTKL